MLKNYSEVCNVFIKFKTLVKNQSNIKIKIYKYDNTKEYLSNEFISFYKKE